MRILILLFSLIICSCVTVNVGEETPKKSTDIRFAVPKKPFEEHASPSADKAWVSTATGNVISFASECPENSDPSLETLTKESLQSLDRLEIVSKESISFNNRDAISSFAKGSVDGVPLAMKTIIFKKNGCNYRIMLSGLLGKISLEQNQFDDFCKEFKAP
jgi:hypothetical protein